MTAKPTVPLDDVHVVVWALDLAPKPTTPAAVAARRALAAARTRFAESAGTEGAWLALVKIARGIYDDACTNPSPVQEWNALKRRSAPKGRSKTTL